MADHLQSSALCVPDELSALGSSLLTNAHRNRKTSCNTVQRQGPCCCQEVRSRKQLCQLPKTAKNSLCHAKLIHSFNRHKLTMHTCSLRQGTVLEMSGLNHAESHLVTPFCHVSRTKNLRSHRKRYVKKCLKLWNLEKQTFFYKPHFFSIFSLLKCFWREKALARSSASVLRDLVKLHMYNIYIYIYIDVTYVGNHVTTWLVMTYHDFLMICFSFRIRKNLVMDGFSEFPMDGLY